MAMNRRTFVIHSLVGSAALAAATLSRADVPKVAETDANAVGLGYKEDATKADKAKFPKYAAGQQCSSCQLYQGPATGRGNCALFAGKSVAAAGWCSAYAKKA
ncbi:MAG: high-potential iron-sulfur protein [Herminiimonas sp.]|nr:high-potential iron-sulfur protein [Herminiimonas sp.]MBC7414359.1 high-potential iron-sulfur protein [Herminiimonas sp.]